jgi:hypothetical protein
VNACDFFRHVVDTKQLNTKVINNILEEEVVPPHWKSSTIILLSKQGSKNDFNNFRPITLLPNLYKLFLKIILRRLTKILDEKKPPRKNRLPSWLYYCRLLTSHKQK